VRLLPALRWRCAALRASGGSLAEYAAAAATERKPPLCCYTCCASLLPACTVMDGGVVAQAGTLAPPAAQQRAQRRQARRHRAPRHFPARKTAAPLPRWRGWRFQTAGTGARDGREDDARRMARLLLLLTPAAMPALSSAASARACCTAALCTFSPSCLLSPCSACCTRLLTLVFLFPHGVLLLYARWRILVLTTGRVGVLGAISAVTATGDALRHKNGGMRPLGAGRGTVGMDEATAGSGRAGHFVRRQRRAIHRRLL